jgi:hypothetical protein
MSNTALLEIEAPPVGLATDGVAGAEDASGAGSLAAG